MMRVLLLLSLFCVVCSVSLPCVFASVPCFFKDDATQESFNFEPLSLKAGTYQGPNGLGGWSSATCTTDQCKNSNYTYLFNFCAATLKKPPNCGENEEGVSAYQYKTGTTQCYIVGKASAQTFQLIKPGQPSQGFMVTYNSDGPKCNKSDVPRTFNIHVRCSANLPADPQLDYANKQFQGTIQRHSTMSTNTLSLASTSCNLPDCNIRIGDVYENSTRSCEYHVNVDTVFGCPNSCLIDNTACSNHGICAEDTDAHVTRCFCDFGYGGNKCQHTVDTSPSTSTGSPNTALTVFVLILLFAALGLGYALYRKIRGFHGDYDHQYGQLSDGGKPQGGRGITINTA